LGIRPGEPISPRCAKKSSTTETFKKCSILFKVKNGENFNRRNTRQVFRGLKSESDSEVGQKGAFFKGLKREVRDI
jgi:hypothetical protein